MKKSIAILTFLALLLLPSCGEIFKPDHAEDREVLISVYKKSSSFNFMSKPADESYMTQNTKMLEYYVNEDVIAENYICYYIIYQIDDINGYRRYALVDFVEFNNGYCEWKVIDTSRSLSDIMSNFE